MTGRRILALVGGAIALGVAVAALASIAAAAGDAISVTARPGRSGGVDFSGAPAEQQPACIVAIGGVVLFSAETVEHANTVRDGLIHVAGRDSVTFTAGDYTATVTFAYHGQGRPDVHGEVIVITPVDVDLVSSTTGDVVRTTWRFWGGANVGDFGLATFSLGLPNYTDVTCRGA